MAEVPLNITRAHLLKAIERIEQEGLPEKGHSSTYDVVFDGKAYPPKVVVSWANVYANGEELDRNAFEGGKGTACFKLLEKEQFQIVKKDNVVEINLTDGAIKNGYLNVRGKEEWFPREVVSDDGSDPSRVVEIKLPDGTVEKTFILKKHGRIKKRLGKLFRENALKAGQVAYLTKVTDYKYDLSFGSASELIKSIRENTEDYNALEMERAMPALNQILYGPPGTGKTYSTIDKALEVLDLPFVDKIKAEADNREHARALLKKRFDELKEQGRIHFVTFHQSFSYEDFVEGIKASTLETGISYSVESGIFKKACIACKKTGSTHDLDSALNQFVEEIAVKSMTLKTPTGKEFISFYKGGNTTITCIPKASEEKRELPASIEHIKQVLKGVRPDNIYCESYVNGIVSHVMSKLPASSSNFYVGQAFDKYRVTKVSDQIVEITKPNGKVLPYPMSVLNELKGFVESGQISVKDIGNKGWQELESDIEPYLVNGYDNLVPQLVEYLIDGGKTEPLSSKEDFPVVLIIDEINRGNISSIFGELITLIEPSKRAGADEALSVTLPYSKETFQVPSNLYLIGTMNTADRSLALMDTALRRRFDFVEMMPDVSLLDGVTVKGIDVAKMLLKMNQRIEVLYDREHTLGHAFFMQLKDVEDDDQRFSLLQNIFANKILPLLEEYFFEDWAKIRLVLGDDGKESVHQFITENGKDYDVATLFSKNVDLGYEIEEQKSYTRNDGALAHPESYLGIYAE